MPPRFLELDVLRGIAIVFMIVYHFIFDWNFFVQPVVDLNQGWWFYFGRFTAALFIGLAGLSLTLSAHRSAHAYTEKWRALVQKGIFILGLGMIISLITYITFPAYAIWFGVLHLMGVSLIVGAFLVHRPTLTLLAGILFTGLGVLFSTILHSTLPFWPILLPVSFQTFDYFPLFPWLGVFLLGMSAGNYLYPQGNPHSLLGWKKTNVITNLFAELGRKSLMIYFVHQPVLIGLLLAMGKINPSVFGA